MNPIQQSCLALWVATAVILSGVHAKELSALNYYHSMAKKSSDDGSSSGMAKNTVELHSHLHNHVDKQSLKTALQIHSDSLNTDGRSLRATSHSGSLGISARLSLQFAILKRYLLPSRIFG